jgi:23S rRNA (adenine1618-N6)-methyltransferase
MSRDETKSRQPQQWRGRAGVEKPGLHPRSRHHERYDLPALVACCPELEAFVVASPVGEATIDFANPQAVKGLNRALLKHHYGVAYWDLPLGYLCPGIPGRADYLHQVADLISGGDGTAILRGPEVTVLDIGTGANVVYPLIGVAEYGWRFVGVDIDPLAVKWAGRLLAANPALEGRVEVRLQKNAERLFEGAVRPGERFTVAICNPPFHASPEAAEAEAARKVRGLGRRSATVPKLNFAGQGAELWCPGGEVAFIGRMIQQSALQPELCGWFTSLVSRSENLPKFQRELQRVAAKEVRVLPMAQGQKRSRLVAWRF